MIPSKVLESVRFQCAESASNSFWTDPEIYGYMTEAEQIIAEIVKATKTKDSSIITTSGIREYTKPSGVMTLERVTYDDARLEKITINQLDDLEGISYGSTGQTGQPTHYYEYGNEIGFSPKPDDAKTVTLYYSGSPATLSAASTSFTIPNDYGQYAADYILYRMYLKDDELNGQGKIHLQIWEGNLVKIRDNWEDREYHDQNIIVTDMGA